MLDVSNLPGGDDDMKATCEICGEKLRGESERRAAENLKRHIYSRHRTSPQDDMEEAEPTI